MHAETKTCEVCGQKFTRNSGQGPKSFAKQRACGPICGQNLRWSRDCFGFGDEPDEATQAEVASRALAVREAHFAAMGCVYSGSDD